jgi:serine/threonine protein kinase
VTLVSGTRLGPYEIVSALGAGGMGEVYRARDTKLGRDVALKILPAAFTTDAERLARFRREAQVLASLNHPHIGAIYGLDEANGSQFLVLELVDGESLDKRIARGALPVDEALGIAKQIAEALEAAHEKGIIHRDLKPANIALTQDGHVKVLDFGLAKAMEPASGTPFDLANSPTITSPAMMTGVGMILGTAAYMSPEQAKGRPADKRSDVWAFGCVLYEMLTAKRAFEGEDVSDTLAAVLRGQPNWTALPADLPPLFRTLVRRCLEKDPRQRLADVSIVLFVIKELPDYSATLTQPTVRSLNAWRRVAPVLATAIATLALGGLAVWRFRPSTPLTVTRFSVTLGEGQHFTNTSRRVLAISPDGTEMVYVANRQLYLRSMSELEARPIPGTGPVKVDDPGVSPGPVFSPDGRSVAFETSGILKRIGVGGGTPVTISDLGGNFQSPRLPQNVFGMHWDEDTILLGLGRRGVMRVSANGGTLEQIVTIKDDQVAQGPQLLPGGRTVLFTLATGTSEDRWDTAKILVQSLQSGERKTLIDGGADARYLLTGHVVFARGGTLFAIPFDLGRLEVVGSPVPIVEGVRRARDTGNFAAAHFSISNTGSLVYLPGPTSIASIPRDLALMDREGTVRTLRLPARPYETPRFSPDGTQVAVGTDDGKDAIIWIHDLAGSSATRRLTLEGRNRFPIWSADGQRVAFQSDREGDLGIFWQRADGSGTPERLTRPDHGDSHVPHSWSPDGKRFLFSTATGTTFSLWTFSLSDRKAAPFGAVQSSVLPNAVFSPDGQWVAYGSRETAGGGLLVQPFPSTGEKRQIADEGGLPLWSKDGRLFFGSATTAIDLNVVSITTRPKVTVGARTRVPRVGSMVARSSLNLPRNWDISADGLQQIGVVDAEETQPQIRVVLNWFEELKARVPTK